MNERELKVEFGQIVLESYSLPEIIVIGQLTEAYSELYGYEC